DVPRTKISATAGTRCVGDKVIVTVQLTNDEEVHVSASATSAYGSRPFGAVPPGKQKTRSFPTDAAQVPAGRVTVTVSAAVDGTPLEMTLKAPFEARACGSE